MRSGKLIALALLYSSFSSAAESTANGKKIAFDRTKGNCLACHEIAGGASPGNIGPPLSNMKQRYPDRSLLRQRVWDETRFNPATVMPPFGKHQILTEKEINEVIEFIYTL